MSYKNMDANLFFIPFVFMDANLFFIPLVHNGHYAAVRINFNKSVDILDNQKLKQPIEESVVNRCAKFVAVEGASDYFEKWNLGKGCGILNYEVRSIKFKWQQDDSNNTESGLFTMMHLALFEGSVFDDENIRLKKNRRFLVVQLAAAFLLADCNRLRDDLLQKVSNFIENKSALWKKIKDKRDFEMLVKKQAGK